MRKYSYLTKTELKKIIRDLDKQIINLNKWSKSQYRKMCLQRDNHKCRLCGETEINTLQVHHLTPKFMGGDDSNFNLISVCESCHLFLHCNPKMIMSQKKFHSERTKEGLRGNNKVGKRGKDKKPRSKRGGANEPPKHIIFNNGGVNQNEL